MKRRRVILAAGLVVVVGALLVWLMNAANAPEDPRYEGKKLSEWVKECGATNIDQAERARFIIGQMGTNTVPYMVGRLKRVALKTYWLKRADGWLHTGTKYEQSNEAQVLGVRRGIGGVGRPMIPELELIMEESTNPEVLSEAYLAAMGILSREDSPSNPMTLSSNAVAKVIAAMTWPRTIATPGVALIGVQTKANTGTATGDQQKN